MWGRGGVTSPPDVPKALSLCHRALLPREGVGGLQSLCRDTASVPRCCWGGAGCAQSPVCDSSARCLLLAPLTQIATCLLLLPAPGILQQIMGGFVGILHHKQLPPPYSCPKALLDALLIPRKLLLPWQVEGGGCFVPSVSEGRQCYGENLLFSRKTRKPDLCTWTFWGCRVPESLGQPCP